MLAIRISGKNWNGGDIPTHNVPFLFDFEDGKVDYAKIWDEVKRKFGGFAPDGPSVTGEVIFNGKTVETYTVTRHRF